MGDPTGERLIAVLETLTDEGQFGIGVCNLAKLQGLPVSKRSVDVKRSEARKLSLSFI